MVEVSILKKSLTILQLLPYRYCVCVLGNLYRFSNVYRIVQFSIYRYEETIQFSLCTLSVVFVYLFFYAKFVGNLHQLSKTHFLQKLAKGHLGQLADLNGD